MRTRRSTLALASSSCDVRRLNHRLECAICEMTLAELHLRLGHTHKAEALMKRNLSVLLQQGDSRVRGVALLCVAEIRIRNSSKESASRYLAKALSAFVHAEDVSKCTRIIYKHDFSTMNLIQERDPLHRNGMRSLPSCARCLRSPDSIDFSTPQSSWRRRLRWASIEHLLKRNGTKYNKIKFHNYLLATRARMNKHRSKKMKETHPTNDRSPESNIIVTFHCDTTSGNLLLVFTVVAFERDKIHFRGTIGRITDKRILRWANHQNTWL